MLKHIIAWSVRHKLLVILGTVVVTLAGLRALFHTPVDAIPDLSDVQVIVMTEWPGQAPQLVEDQVTYPLSTELLKVPKIKFVRGMSQFGLSAVYVVFEDNTDLYWARSRVLEYLNGVRNKLPEGAQPMLGPDATGVGWVMQYILTDTTGTLNLAQLRGLQDFTVRPALTSVSGVAEIASLGGFEKQYQIEVDPTKLLAYGIPLNRVTDAVRNSNADVGGRVLEMAGSEYVVRARAVPNPRRHSPRVARHGNRRYADPADRCRQRADWSRHPARHRRSRWPRRDRDGMGRHAIRREPPRRDQWREGEDDRDSARAAQRGCVRKWV
jgi:copper/silver efflux system protein